MYAIRIAHPVDCGRLLPGLSAPRWSFDKRSLMSALRIRIPTESLEADPLEYLYSNRSIKTILESKCVISSTLMKCRFFTLLLMF